MQRLKFIPELLSISRRSGKAIGDYDMIHAGDRIAVAVSGGKDSISLLHVLRHRQLVSPVEFEFQAVHIDFGFSDFSPERLLAYLEREGFSCLVEKVESLQGDRWENIDCYWWSQNRRKALFAICERLGFNKIAFGHHMDDIVETILLNLFYRGEIGAMKPKQELFGGKVTIIRPLAYEREEKMVGLAEKLNIQSIGGQSKCANDATSHRMKIKKMLKDFEQTNPQIIKNQNIRNLPYYEYTFGFAQHHYHIIDHFGRFPHRNHILQRNSTPEESKFLQKPGSRLNDDQRFKRR